MEVNAGVISNLRRLAMAQVTDEAWLSAATQQCGIDLANLTIDYWNKTFYPKNMDTVEEFTFLEEKGIKWERPDGGMPMAITDNVPQYIVLTRFLLFAGLIKALKANGEISYAKVGGPPVNWKHSKVFINNREVDNIISADAILGTIEFYKKDKAGNLVTNKEKDSIETMKISGIVKIVPGELPLTFF